MLNEYTQIPLTSPSELYNKSLEYFKKRITENTNNDTNNSFTSKITAIVKLMDEYNSYLLLTNGYEARILDDLLKKSTTMEKFIIEETGLYIRNCFNSTDEIVNLIKLVACSFSTLGGEESVLQNTLLNKLPTFEEAVVSLNDNIWLLTLIIIKDALDEKF